jgi:hypothetical protein
MRLPKRRLVVGFFLAAGLPVACSSGSASDSAAGERGAFTEAGGVCNSCSIDTDCRNSCPNPSQSGYVWCSGLGLCFTWAKACPPTADGESGGSPLDSGSDAEEIAACPSSAGRRGRLEYELGLLDGRLHWRELGPVAHAELVGRRSCGSAAHHRLGNLLHGRRCGPRFHDWRELRSLRAFTHSASVAWGVRFDSANPVGFDLSSSNSVRCVR